jgi:glutathione S-transferase
MTTALNASGLRILVAAGVPSPWSQAALSILHFKKLPFVAARTHALDPAFQQWNGAVNLPAVLMDDEPVRTGWVEILALAERLTPDISLIPTNPHERIRMMGLCHEVMGEGALLWCARLLAIDAGLSSGGVDGFPQRAAQYLAPRYGWAKTSIATARTRALEALALLDNELGRVPGPYYAGNQLTALDLYSVAAMNALVPLPETDCPISPPFRAAFTWMGKTLGDAITPALLRHRDEIVVSHFALPIEL